MRRIFITENQYKRILEAYSQDDGIEFGEPVAIAAQQVRFPVSIDGVTYSTEQINFIIEPHVIQGATLYQPHIFIAPELQQKGFGYRIYRRFVHEYGNLYSSEWSKTNNTGAIDKIYQRLGSEPDITVIYDEDKQGKYLIAYLTSTDEPINEDVSETMSGIDNRMIPLAKHIYQNAIKALETNTKPEPISAEEVNNSQDYFRINMPLYIDIYNDFSENTIARLSHDKNNIYRLQINRNCLKQNKVPISAIMHELTHMVNGACTNYSQIMNYGDSDYKDYQDDAQLTTFIKDFCYLFNESEMQARLSEYYHACQNGDIVIPNNSIILDIDDMEKLIDKIETNPTYSYWACIAYKNRYKHKLASFKEYRYPLYPGATTPNSPYISFITKKKKQLFNYIRKAKKIYGYFLSLSSKK